ncbi:MAG: tetratricopeptide repeat protein [Dongiaceae bacterium]
MRYSHGLLMAGALALGLPLALPVDLGWAAGGGGSSSSGGSSGGKSNTSSSNSESALYADAKARVEAEDYRGAMPILEKVLAKNSSNADALNLMGYCSRKLGDFDEALEYYQKALAIDADHIGANEYLGELYLQMKDLPKAEERLKVLTEACNGCEEQEELEEAIADYKANNS